MARLVDAPTSSLHAVAPLLRGHRQPAWRPTCWLTGWWQRCSRSSWPSAWPRDALDELHGRPLGTRIPSRWLIAVATVGLAGAVTLGAFGVSRAGWTLIPFIVVGPGLVVAYNTDVGAVHKDIVFAAAWGAFPVLTAYVAETERLAWAPVLAARWLPSACPRPSGAFQRPPGCCAGGLSK